MFTMKSAYIIHLYKLCEAIVDVGSFRQEKATTWTNVIKEKKLLVLQKQNVKSYDENMSFHYNPFTICKISVLFQSFCGPSFEPLPVLSPTPPSPERLEKLHLKDASNQKPLSDWTTSQVTAAKEIEDTESELSGVGRRKGKQSHKRKTKPMSDSSSVYSCHLA